jgi:hypothetical protein
MAADGGRALDGSVATGGVAGTGGSLPTAGTRGTGGVPATTDSDGCTVGPGGYCWYLDAAGDATVAWADTPGPSAVHVSAKSASNGSAGMTGLLNWGAPVDLGQYDQLWFDATVPSGQRIGVGLGRKSTGEACTWDVIGFGTGRYTVDLRTARFCWPQTCGLSRSQIEAVSFFSDEWSTNYSLDLTVTNLGFAATTAISTSMIAGKGATLGLNGWCWSLFSWTNNPGPIINATASWKTAPTSSQVEVQVTDADTDGAAGCTVQVPDGQTDMTEATYLEFDANVALSNGTSFTVTLNDVNRAYCAYPVDAYPGAHTYRIALAGTRNCGKSGEQSFNQGKVYSIDFSSPWALATNADLTITRLVIQ